jgi:hypothetical protein
MSIMRLMILGMVGLFIVQVILWLMGRSGALVLVPIMILWLAALFINK